MINPKDIPKIKNRLGNLVALKHHQGNNDYLNGSIDMAELFLQLISNRSNSTKYREALSIIENKGRTAKSMRPEDQKDGRENK